MATVYRASLVSIIVVDAGGTATPLGIAENFTIQKTFEAESLREIGSFFSPEIVIHGVSATFSWQKAWQKGQAGRGYIPTDEGISAFEPFAARVIDQESQRLIATLYKAVPQSFEVAITARGVLRQSVSGICITALFENELN